MYSAESLQIQIKRRFFLLSRHYFHKFKHHTYATFVNLNLLPPTEYEKLFIDLSLLCSDDIFPPHQLSDVIRERFMWECQNLYSFRDIVS